MSVHRRFCKRAGSSGGMQKGSANTGPSRQEVFSVTGTRRKVFKHVCPKNCFSSCTMFSVVENGRIAELKGDSAHPYTNGKLCAKGFALMEMNRHPERLKYPYYQEVKGSGKFIKISWEKAYDLIISEMVHIPAEQPFPSPRILCGNRQHGRSTPGDRAFFAGLPGRQKSLTFLQLCWRLATCRRTRKAPGHGSERSGTHCDLGSQPRRHQCPSYPFLIEARVKGAKIVVIDPLYTQTAEMADLYVQLRPGSDAKLACLLLKGLLESDHFLKNAR